MLHFQKTFFYTHDGSEVVMSGTSNVITFLLAVCSCMNQRKGVQTLLAQAIGESLVLYCRFLFLSAAP